MQNAEHTFGLWRTGGAQQGAKLMSAKTFARVREGLRHSPATRFVNTHARIHARSTHARTHTRTHAHCSSREHPHPRPSLKPNLHQQLLLHPKDSAPPPPNIWNILPKLPLGDTTASLPHFLAVGKSMQNSLASLKSLLPKPLLPQGQRSSCSSVPTPPGSPPGPSPLPSVHPSPPSLFPSLSHLICPPSNHSHPPLTLHVGKLRLWERIHHRTCSKRWMCRPGRHCTQRAWSGTWRALSVCPFPSPSPFSSSALPLHGSRLG